MATVTPAAVDPTKPLMAQRVRLEPYGIDVGPTTHQRDERERLAGLRWEHFDATVLGATIGAELRGLDLTAEPAAGVVEEIRHALLDYKVVFFRDQPLTPDQHVAFAARFGDLEVHPFLPDNSERPELVRFEKTPDVGGYENGWHSDVSWREIPSMGSILHGIEVPPSGGDTLFADMYAAYDGLDDETKAEIADLRAVHDYVQVFGHMLTPDQRVEMSEKYPATEHPVVRTHPETGRRLVYVNRFFVTGIVGLDPDASTALIDRLCRTADVPEYQCRFHWEKDSVAFWDNRAVQHYASSDYWPARRVMERATVIGTRPA